MNRRPPAQLAVCTPAYNDAGFLPECIESVKVAAARAPFPIVHVVTDDGSTDATPKVLARHADVLAQRLPANRGASAALNVAVRMTTTPWVLILAADDVVLRWAFADFARMLLQRPDANVIYSDLENFGTRHDTYRIKPFDSVAMTHRNVLPGCSFIRREVFDAIGGFDESMRSAMDWDFWVRADLVVGLQPAKMRRPAIGYRWHTTPRLHNRSAAHFESIRWHIASRTRDNAVLPIVPEAECA